MNRTSQKRGFNALKVGSIWLFLLLLMAALSLVAVSVGSAGYSLGEILRAVFSGEESTIKVIIFNLRLPRLLLALLIGASLSASGALLQSVMRNPLADPGTIGVSAGAGTAATTILLIFPHLTNSVPIFAFAGVGLVLAFACIKSANTLQLGDEMAKSLGVKVNLARVFLSAVSAFLAAATVSVAGMIGFVGLVVPHISRLLVGSDYKTMMPTSVLLGAVVLLAADTIGRTVVPGMEIPVGIVMAVTGGPFFLYMLRKNKKVG